MSSPRVSLALVSLSLIVGACVVQPPQRTDEADGQGGDAKADGGDAKAVTAKAGEVDPKEKYKLSAEEEALLLRDPKELTRDENRKRGQALRKKIMQNPDSDAAKALEEARQAALAGQLDPNIEKKEPGIVIEAPEHLRNVDQTHDRGAKDE